MYNSQDITLRQMLAQVRCCPMFKGFTYCVIHLLSFHSISVLPILSCLSLPSATCFSLSLPFPVSLPSSLPLPLFFSYSLTHSPLTVSHSVPLSQMSGLPRVSPCLNSTAENACPSTTDEILNVLKSMILIHPPWTMPSYRYFSLSISTNCYACFKCIF